MMTALTYVLIFSPKHCLGNDYQFLYRHEIPRPNLVFEQVYFFALNCETKEECPALIEKIYQQSLLKTVTKQSVVDAAILLSLDMNIKDHFHELPAIPDEFVQASRLLVAGIPRDKLLFIPTVHTVESWAEGLARIAQLMKEKQSSL